jgi:methylenetetrahydrofolate dehydrogenase (NADP+)/methenyltetrahydrofolate cyclohydrolase
MPMAERKGGRAVLIDGRVSAHRVLEEARAEARTFRERVGRAAGLAVVLVGDDPASCVYVSSKEKTGKETGISSVIHRLPEETPTSEIISLVDRLNSDERVDGILVQLPLPGTVDELAVLDRVRRDKDVDGLHPANVGKLVRGDRDTLVSCTPAGCMRLLDDHGLDPEGKRAVVVGRSDIVGKPLAMLLLHRHATVTICHSRTVGLAGVCREADILVAAVGRPFLVGGDWVKKGAAVIDVGINRVTGREIPERLRTLVLAREGRAEALKQKGSILVGDVSPEAEEVAGHLTPVPGGVGPMTIAMLMKNTLQAARLRAETAMKR